MNGERDGERRRHSESLERSMLALRDAREPHDVLAIAVRALARDFRRTTTAYQLRDSSFRPVASSDVGRERAPIPSSALDVAGLRIRGLMRRGPEDLIGIASDGTLRAVLVLEDAPGTLPEEDAKYLRAFGVHVSLALTTAFAFEQLRRYAAEGAALTEAARTILGFTEFEPLARALCRLCMRLVLADRVAVYTRNGDGLVRAGLAAQRDDLTMPDDLPVDDRAARALLEETLGGRALAVARLSHFPVDQDPELRGLLVCTRALPFERTEQRFIETFANLAALAVRNVDLYEQSTRANQALAESNAFKDDLMAMFAHDFKGPLTVISGFAELLFDVEESGVRRSAETIVEQTHRLARLSEDALALAATQSAGFSLQRGVEDIAAFVSSAVDTLDPQGARVTVEAPTEPILVSFDRMRLRHAVDNVVGNALKYSKGPVDVRIGGSADEVWVAVCDRGIGVPLADLDKIFSRFGRGANARSSGVAGSGVGLYIAKKIVEVHGGRLDVRSTENQGSTFRIVLPR